MASKNESIQLVRIEQQGPDAGERRMLRLRRPDDVLFESAGEPECRALARDACDSDPPTHQIDQLFRDRESQSRSAESARGRSIRLREWREEAALIRLRGAAAGVVDEEPQFGRVGGVALAPHPDI